jgi:outer membrane protein OmpA-like peptidoglycan-associated protein
VITLPERVLFDFGKADLKPAAQQTLSDVRR